MAFKTLRKFLKLESASGIVLLLATVMALILQNSPLSEIYQNIFTTPLEIQLGGFKSSQPLLFWINEGLMTLFFLLVSLELKREFLMGELASFSKVMLPGMAALGGMLVPAVIFVMINQGSPETLKGWAVPVATDIAFALGILSLFGKRVPLGLKLFLMSLAIFDDVGAIIIIALFYTMKLHYLWLFFGSLIILVMWLLNIFKVKNLLPYILAGIALWMCVLHSGVHATVAGVLFAFMIPLKGMKSESPLQRMEKFLHPWVAFLLIPLFALANAGIAFGQLNSSLLTSYLFVGILLGLVLGKQLGVFCFTWITIRCGWAKLPKNVSWRAIYGAALLCGIGFTMSLFLGTLSFAQSDPIYLLEVRMAVLTGSIISGIIGAWFLSCVLKKEGGKVEAS